MKFLLSLFGIRPVGIQRSNPFFLFLQSFFSLYSLRSAILIVICGLFLFHYTQTKKHQQSDVLNMLRNTGSYMMDPVVNFMNIPINWIVHQWEITRSYSYLRSENLYLKNLLAQKEAQENLHNLIDKENMALRRMLHIVPAPPLKITTTRVLGYRSDKHSNRMLAQIPHTFKKTHRYYAQGPSGLCGKASGKQGNTLNIILITDAESRVPVRLIRTGEHAILGGTGKDLRIVHIEKHQLHKDIKKETQLEIGDMFVTSGMGIFYQPNIPVGKVVGFQSGEALIEPVERFSSIKFVRIADAG